MPNKRISTRKEMARLKRQLKDANEKVGFILRESKRILAEDGAQMRAEKRMVERERDALRAQLESLTWKQWFALCPLFHRKENRNTEPM
jgi:hypothetical protein